jgi:hypothetical protein
LHPKWIKIRGSGQKSLEGGFVDENIDVHGNADHLCSAASRLGKSGAGGLRGNAIMMGENDRK